MNTNLSVITGTGAALALACLLAGCTTLSPSAQTQARIQEKSEAFNKLTPQQQGNILGGAIERGNTMDMVYMALGKPQRIVTSADGLKAMWVYVEYYTANGPAKYSLNNPNTKYTSQVVAANTPFAGGPGLKAVAPAEFSATGGAHSQSLDLPDMKEKTIYIFFHLGKVAEIKLDGDSSDQQNPAPAVAPAKQR